jgi:hypothetical protein
LILIVLPLLLVPTFTIIRSHLALEHRWRLGFEMVALLTPMAATGLAIGLAPIGALTDEATKRAGKLAAALCAMAASVLVIRGGTYIVRALLDQAKLLPRASPRSIGFSRTAIAKAVVDIAEFNRGRSIGNLERLLMLLVVSLGRYEALGFLIAAKGLIRAKEFEDRNFAEYFILGSLSSAACAMAVGIALRAAVVYLWQLP